VKRKTGHIRESDEDESVPGINGSAQSKLPGMIGAKKKVQVGI